MAGSCLSALGRVTQQRRRWSRTNDSAATDPKRTLDRLTLMARMFQIARVRRSIKIMQKLFEGSAVSPLMPFWRIYVTIAVVWQEDGFQWCAADTRLVAGDDDRPATEIAAKIYAIPVVVSAMGNGFPSQPHYWTQYGFVYAGAALPATMTAVTASTLLQKLTRPGDREDPPTFEQIAEFVCRLAKRFMTERRQFGGDGIFSAMFFGWCPHKAIYKLAYINGRDDAGGFRVELTYPAPPQVDGDPWFILGSGDKMFKSTLAEYRNTERHITKRVPRRVIDKMVDEAPNRTVGGATSIGMARRNGFELFYVIEPITPGQPEALRIFNGLDLDTEIGPIGQYHVAITGLA